MPSQPTFPTDRLRIERWDDPLVDQLGHDPRSAYVETYWLGILGPSACWLLRRLAEGLDAEPQGFDLELAETASAIGLRLNGGRHAPFLRTLGRLCQFKMARQCGLDVLEVRRHLPPLTLAQVDRLPTTLRDQHQALASDRRSAAAGDEVTTRRARRLALTLVQLGEDREATARQLVEWRFDPQLCESASIWAWGARHRLAARPAARRTPVPPAVRRTLDGAA